MLMDNGYSLQISAKNGIKFFCIYAQCPDSNALTDKALKETNVNRKGMFWEDAAAYMLGSIAGWKISGRRVRAGAQEIDLSLVNCSLDDRLWQLGAYILVEWGKSCRYSAGPKYCARFQHEGEQDCDPICGKRNNGKCKGRDMPSYDREFLSDLHHCR